MAKAVLIDCTNHIILLTPR